ncbi:PDZ domain-containing protein [Gimesia aquarii]|uniref:Serine endoprotease n=1 Tax=Gimesia aquarii TaxID=2527964 RepID=A0A517W418_9PLAN|nr:PDZ domain-containing protein [Gimesia aquarii]QDU00003.1 serine endoprotease [Gimesia aquarii]
MSITKRIPYVVLMALFICLILIGIQVYSMGQTNKSAKPSSGIVESKSESAADSQTENKSSTTQKVKKTTLGVHVSKLSQALRKHLKLSEDVGLIVEHVVDGSAAAKSGLQPYDVLHKFEDQLLINREQLTALVNLHGPKSKVAFTVIRNGVSTRIEAILQAKNVPAIGYGFDAFDYFHGHAGRQELQKCALCHVGHDGAIDQHGKFDNYKFFHHGKPTGVELQDCSACHARVVHPLKLNGF